MAVVKRRPARSKPPSKPAIDMSLVRQFLTNRRVASEANKAVEAAKGELKPFVMDNGYTGPDGHIYYDLPEPVEGFGALQQRRNVTPKVDEAAAEKILSKLGILDECTEETYVFKTDEESRAKVIRALRSAGVWDDVVDTHRSISDEKITAYHAVHPKVLTEEHIDQILVEEVTWAFWPVERAAVAG